MKEEGSPISDDEWLYRRVHRDRWKTERAPIISPSAFEPRVKGRDPDVDGISLYRADCLNGPGDVLGPIQDAEKRRQNGVVKISVAELKKMGLSIRSSPVPGISGHVVIPELDVKSFEGDPEKVRERMLKLAEKSSSEENLILPPASLAWPQS